MTIRRLPSRSGLCVFCLGLVSAVSVHAQEPLFTNVTEEAIPFNLFEAIGMTFGVTFLVHVEISVKSGSYCSSGETELIIGCSCILTI